ncbi:PSP1 domain-containing protein, partial [Adlercreutzia equolifaciens]
MVRVAPINLTFNPRTLWFDPGDLDIEKDMPVVVRTARGTEFGIAASEVIEVSEEQVRALKSALRPVERIATEEDIEQAAEMERASAEALPVFKEMAREYHEDMHPVSVEFLLDGDKAVFYFEAEERIDFRELVRKLAARFHVRIDMRQIGVRDEARMVGGIGHCGQELCCKRLGGEFCPVSIRMAKEQGLSLNPQKISGLCGRLMCCLRYEFDAYKDFKGRAPKLNATVQTPAGPAKVVDHDVPREIVSLKVEGEKPVKVPLSDFDPAPEGATRPNAVGEEAWEEATSDRGLIGGEALIFSTSQFTGADKLAEGAKVRHTGGSRKGSGEAGRSRRSGSEGRGRGSSRSAG